VVLLVVVFGLGVIAGRVWQALREWPTTTSLLSPDGRHRARLVERPRSFDRNFKVLIEDPALTPSPARTVFESPDEGRPVGSERFIWSADGNVVFLVGRHFMMDVNAPELATGEAVYLMHDLRSGETWCNARHASGVRFNRADAERLGLTEPLRVGPTGDAVPRR
jgi:hypothetical protein